MKRIRFAFFETNSSSSHSLVVMPKADYELWKKDEDLCYNFNSRSFLTTLQRKLEVKKDIIKWEQNRTGKVFLETVSDDRIQDWLNDCYGEYPLTYNEFNDDPFLEIDTNFYTTPKEEQLVMLCKYGNS